MKFLVILFVTGCVIANVHSKPLDSRDDLQKFFSKMIEMKSTLRECARKTLEYKDEELEDFKEYLINLDETSNDTFSKLGTDDFDIVEFRDLCTELNGKIYSLLLSLGNEFVKCATDEDIIKIVDLALDFYKQFSVFHCNLSAKELSYFHPDRNEDMSMCLQESFPKTEKCVIFKNSNLFDSNDDNSIKASLCKIDLTASGECLRNVLSECGEEGSRGLIIMIDFTLKYIEQKLECEDLTENTV